MRDREVAATLVPEIETYLEVFVAGLLVLLGHGGRLATGEEASGTEQQTGCANTQHDVHEDLGALTRRSLSAGTVRTECDPVGCAAGLACVHMHSYAIVESGFILHESRASPPS